jgi:hypothetical protein
MEQRVTVRIFGTLTACREGTVDAWRDTTAFARHALSKRFGDQVAVEYYDLFSPEIWGVAVFGRQGLGAGHPPPAGGNRPQAATVARWRPQGDEGVFIARERS